MIENAIREAYASEAEGDKVGCVITDKRGRIISTGRNSFTKSHPIQADFAARVGEPDRIFLHAEIRALIKCREIPYAIYVARITQGQNIGYSKPCPACELAIREAGIQKVFFTDFGSMVRELEL